MGILAELKRRNVFKVGVAYIVLGWVVIQVTSIVAPALRLPDWTLSFVTWLGVIGFPFVLLAAWAYELTPEGVDLHRILIQLRRIIAQRTDPPERPGKP